MGLEVRIERPRCIGSRICVNRAPEVFQLDQSGIAVVVDAGAGTDEDLVTAAEDCPTAAITVFKDGQRSS